jgi:hypothetical protein
MTRLQLTAEQASEVLHTPPNAYSMTLLRDWLAAHGKNPAKYDPQAELIVPADFRRPPDANAQEEEGGWTVRYAPNWGKISTTTVGRFLASNLAFSRSKALRQAFEFQDVAWDGKVIGGIEQRVVDMRLAGVIDADDVEWVINRLQWLGFAPSSFLVSSMTIDTIRLPKVTRALKTQLVKGELGKAAVGGDLVAMGQLETQLLDSAKKELTDKDPGMDLFNSGARGSWGNNGKMTMVARGAIFDPADPSKYKVSMASLEEGIPADELPDYANILVKASYDRSMSTAKGGYIAKQLNAAFQSIKLDPDMKSDCRTDRTLRVTLDDPRDYLFRFYKEGGKLIEILPDDLPGLKGKVVQLRSPLYCGLKDCLCAKCAGTMYYRMGVQQIGLLANKIGTQMLAGAMKSFHDTSVKMTKVTLNAYTKELK